MAAEKEAERAERRIGEEERNRKRTELKRIQTEHTAIKERLKAFVESRRYDRQQNDRAKAAASSVAKHRIEIAEELEKG